MGLDGPRRFPRRAFLRAAAAVPLPLALLHGRRAAAAASPLGPLRPDPRKILDLPEGFSYRILERALAPMDDGYRVPGRPDGMACFPGPGGTLVLMRNHELYPRQAELGPYAAGQAAPKEAYDPKGMGGVSRLVLRADTFERVSSNLVLAGTTRNCAGGWSPWGWLSCEEDMSDGHGYVFVCATDATSVRPPQRVPGYGRFYHEAAVVDPDTMIAYLTEDREDGCFYRFVPDRREAPFEGRLQALRVVGRDGLETSSALRAGEPLEAAWVDVPDPDPRGDTIRADARARGAATVRRAEGLARHGGALYIASSSGGIAASGQILRYRPAAGGKPETIELVAESTDPGALDRPDNIAFSPSSGELFMAEDGPGENCITVLDARGELYHFARNAASSSELTGVCFSPDGRALFVNIQEDGLTLAITGPFPRTEARAAHSAEPSGFLPQGARRAPPVASGGGAAGGCGGCAAGAGGGAPIATLAGGAMAVSWLARRLSSRR